MKKDNTTTNSPTNRLSKTFKKHSSQYRTLMGQTWGNKGNNDFRRQERISPVTDKKSK
jgi:hypothetical protein